MPRITADRVNSQLDEINMTNQATGNTKMNQESFDKICYRRNFLTAVIARVDLASPLESLGKELPKPISAEALRHFPISEPRPVRTQQISVSGDGLHAESSKEFTEWNFFGRDRGKRLTVATNALFIMYDRYERYENLRNEFGSMVKVFFENCSQAQANRLGLRYVNEVRPGSGTPLDWNDFIQPELLGMFPYSVDDAEPSRIFHNMEFAFADPSFNLRFQFGVFNPDYPAPIRQRVFTLDFDAYCQGLLEVTEIPGLLDKYHATIQSLFERSITQKTREAMNES
jgi:uncharacterized protein (TIGR04255 family)